MPKTKTTSSFPILNRVFPYLLIVCSAIALICSFILSQDELEIARNPSFTPSCNLNPVLSCGNVIRTHQAALFGFPNPWIGMVAFSIFMAVGVVLLAGGQMKRWFWAAMETGLGLAMIFAYWLLLQSVFVIQALCPFCLVVDVVLTTTFWYTTLYVLLNGYIHVPAKFNGVISFARKHHAEILVTWFLLLIALILNHFWYYYGPILLGHH
jgi:uncharacterized membrane protein